MIWLPSSVHPSTDVFLKAEDFRSQRLLPGSLQHSIMSIFQEYLGLSQLVVLFRQDGLTNLGWSCPAVRLPGKSYKLNNNCIALLCVPGVAKLIPQHVNGKFKIKMFMWICYLFLVNVYWIYLPILNNSVFLLLLLTSTYNYYILNTVIKAISKVN